MPNLYVEQLYLIFLNLVVSNWMCNMYYFSVFTDFVLTFFLLGINPVSMRGSKTGVYIGVSGSEAGEAFSKDPEELLGIQHDRMPAGHVCQPLVLLLWFQWYANVTSLITDSLLAHIVEQNWVVRTFVLKDCRHSFCLMWCVVWCDLIKWLITQSRLSTGVTWFILSR